ncbi:DUF6406 domain-containing protein [Actinomadura madurae]|uniref:DUF6406 domain-containing protein n=1 Tax=Actinomadura TaxID=1988 RepID=UPI001160D955|nr:DUF6406 domain-containing protein [Actinomadura madurae]
MALEEIGVQQGTLAELDSDMKIGLVYAREARDDVPPEIVLFIKDDGERDVTLHPGDTFPIGEQTWRFDRVVKAGGNRLGAVFARIE